jgi:FixJ family two-component response regulator
MGNQPERTICLVDDDEDVRNSLVALLESSGFIVRAFSSAADFLGVAGGLRANCLLIDPQMPVMIGLELLEALRARGADAPAIFKTANSIKPHRRFAGTNALTVLRRPFDDEDLLRRVEKACANDVSWLRAIRTNPDIRSPTI